DLPESSWRFAASRSTSGRRGNSFACGSCSAMPWSPFSIVCCHALACDQPNAAFHLALVQRVLAPFEFSFWSFELATLIKTRADGNQEHGSLSLSFLYGWHPGHSDGSLAAVQCSGLGRVLALLCRHHFSLGHRHFAICSNDSSPAAHEQHVERAKPAVIS